MTVKIRKVSEEDIQAQLKQVKEQASLRTAETDAAVDEGVNSPEATQDEDWQEHDQPGHLKRVGDQPFKLLKPWHEMLEHGVMAPDGKPRKLQEIELEPNRFVSAETLATKPYKYQYFPDEGKIKETITEDTLFWYPKGKFNLCANHEPDSEHYGRNPESPDREIAGILLKGVLSQAAQQQALEGLQRMDPWPLPKRPETRTAIERQQGSNTPGEYTMGYAGRMTIERTKAVREHKDAFAQTHRIEEDVL